MFHTLKDLLPNALQRGQISRQVGAARVVQIAADALADILPVARRRDARAVSYKDGTLFVECVHASAADFIRQHADALVHQIATATQTRVDRLQTRLCGRFRTDTLVPPRPGRGLMDEE
jgi:hypothetical protein